ncbi:MAG: TRAP transporter small permease [Deltaproteobacteria bacterium]|nr:MAG: TRAP transporter small permease [Deltaproteobacteria bacterium]
MIKKISYHLNQWIESSLFILGFTMTLLVATQVFCRYVLNQSLFWSEELSRFLLVWLTFLGASCAYYRKVNPGVDFLYAKMPWRLKKISSILTHLLSMALFLIMIIYGYKFAYFVRHQISPALQIPKWIVLSIIPISGAILMFHAATLLVEELREDSNDY